MRVTSWRRRKSRAAFRYVAEDAPSGYGDAADRLVRALRAAGVRIEYRQWSEGAHRHSRDPLPHERAARSAPTVAHLVPEYLPKVRKAVHGPLISHTVWETDRLPSHWPDILNEVDRVIVPTEWNREVFEASGVTKPVVVVPHVVCDPIPGDGGVPLGLSPDVVVFYTIARWDQRKAPSEVIRAFLEAFTADDPVALVVKTTARTQYPAPGPWGHDSAISGTTMLEIARIVRDYPRPALIRVEVEDWAPTRVAGLHTRGDCYVSLAHGEGWGIGAFDAAAYGNPVVMTGWGGQQAFLDADSSFLVDYELQPVRHWEPRFYGADQHWAVPRLEHAVEHLREVAADLDAARRRAAPLRTKVLRDFASKRVVATLFDVVPELGFVADDPSSSLGDQPTAAPESTTSRPRRRRSPADELVLVGVTVGSWRPAFDNWVEMAERHGYRYELLGREIAEPYITNATKWRCLVDFFEDLPRDRLVFHLDASDGFVCVYGDLALARYRSYGTPVVLSAQRGAPVSAPFDVPDRGWSFGNSGGYIGEAGVAADALRKGYELIDWKATGKVSDQQAMIAYFHQPGNDHLATVDYRRTIVQNVARTEGQPEYQQHRALLERGEHGSCTSALHFPGDNGRDYNMFARLYGLLPERVQESGRFHPGEPPPYVGSARISDAGVIPRIAHFVFVGLRSEPEPFHLVHYLAIASCLEVVKPEQVHLHCDQRPYGHYWDLIESHVTVHHVEPARVVSEFAYEDPFVARYAYAHHADFVRLDVLAEHGGLYADLDTLFVAPLPERLWRAPFVIGREADVPNDDGVARPALSNAVLMSKPGSAFVEAWRSEIGDAFDGTWASHSCFLANDLATRFPNEVHVETQRTFHAFEPTPAGIALLLEHPPPALDGVAALHLIAHLWWDKERRDFSHVHAGMVDEEWVRTSDSTYATAARRFLPERE